MERDTSLAGPLDGIVILDLTQAGQAGAGSLLGDMGADVVKIEQPGVGDFMRGLTHYKGIPMMLAGGRNSLCESVNRNKRGITVDISTPRGREVIYRLTRQADVFVHNFRKGVAERQGLDYQTLSTINPLLVYASGTGYGPDGPEAARPALDLTVQAHSGAMMANSEPGCPPCELPYSINDMVGNLTLAYGILLGLMARERHGIGQRVDSSLLGSMANVLRLGINTFFLAGSAPCPTPRNASRNPIWIAYQCADGKWLQLGMSQSDRYWRAFCRAIERQDLVSHPHFMDEQLRSDHREELIGLLDEVFAKRARADWLAALTAHDLPVDACNSVEDLADDPQMLANGYLAELDHPALGRVKMVGIPVRLSKTPGSLRRAMPEVGQHTEEVLLELGGYSWDEIAALREEGVI